MSLLAFRPAWDRIYRAQHHIDEFNRLWSEFLDEEPYSALLNIEDDGAGTLHVEHRYDALPNVFSFELGEALYHLRAALDSSVYGCAVSESGRNPPPDEDRLEFPICSSPSNFKKAGWKIRPLSDECRAIIESIQPYKVVAGLSPALLTLSPHRTVGILNDWARIDRHRRLHIIGSWASHRNPQLYLPDNCELDYLLVTHDGLLEHDSLIARFKLRGFERGMNVQANPNLAIDIAADESPPPCADNDTLQERMRWMLFYTKEIVRALEDECQRKSQLARSQPDTVG